MHIAELRKARGLSQDELAAELDVTRTRVSSWENDRLRPRADHLENLARVLGDDGDLAELARYDDSDQPPLFDPPIPVAGLVRRAAEGLIAHLSEGMASDGQPAFGWRHEVDDTEKPITALSTAYGLKALLLARAHDWRIGVPRLRATLRRLELPDGGWSVRATAPLARPEVTAVVLSALQDAGEAEAYVAERIPVVVETLDRRVEGSEVARPYVLVTTLLELSRLPVDDATARRYLDILVELSRDEDGARSWPTIVKTTGLGSLPSTFHTAAAVCAVAAWARRLDDDELRSVARSGRAWLEQAGNLDLDDEDLRAERADGTVESFQVRHLTPAWVVPGIIETGGDPRRGTADRALRAMLSYYHPDAGLWHWPRSGGMYPVWMTYHAMAALVAWAGAHEIA
jgi:transcriptional regulator with XRE-family HTH domain